MPSDERTSRESRLQAIRATLGDVESVAWLLEEVERLQRAVGENQEGASLINSRTTDDGQATNGAR